MRSSRLRGAAGVALSVTLIAGVLGLAAPASAAELPDPDVPPGEVASSNIEHLSNNPKNGALQGTGSDIAFQGEYAYAGNYDGFTVYDLSDPEAPVQALQVYCPGSQNDISVYGDVLVLSTDSSRSDDSCASTTQSAKKKESWEGLKVWDISNPVEPTYVAAVETACGSHTHSLAPSKDGESVYAYVSSYSPKGSYPDCGKPHDLISVVEIPLDSPEDAAVASTPVLFPDGGFKGSKTGSATTGCHDITTYAELDLAAGACMGDGILMDISDRENPEVISTVRDTENFAFWHSATFNNDATKVVFTDELGGGGLATCTGEYAPELGANGIYDIVDVPQQGGGIGKKLDFKSYYKIPRINDDTENCVAHNGSLIPVEGKDLMVQAWYQGGVSVFDFTDSSNPTELAWFDRGAGLSSGGSWSTYWYNGYAYSNDLGIGFDTFDIDDSIDGKAKTNQKSLNPQMQEKF